MKTLRKNIDLDSKTIAILQIEATLNNHGALKPFLEQLLVNYAGKCIKQRPAIYKAILDSRVARQSPTKKKRP